MIGEHFLSERFSDVDWDILNFRVVLFVVVDEVCC